MLEFIVSKYNFWIYIILMMIGFYAMIAKHNLVKKIIGMNIFQTAIILFFVSTAYKKGGATLPILLNPHGHGHGAAETAVAVSQYINPLPHVLMLTAIVVMVATLGVALAIVIMIYRKYGTLNEDEIIKAMK
ncbi:MAG: cation:proton antiporter subunit C [Deltaproteobacteria bacterium]|jgi:multicomponent Na+:H+ antiporter subunit C|nr:cation:proton antiporter subunit C [Deltaproteobacteria bacterium]